MPKKQFNLHKNKILFDFIANKYFGLKKSDEQDFIKELKEQLKPFETDIFSYTNPLIENLDTYKDNIKKYFDIINKNLEEDIYPTYYQYLSLLFTEIFLDNYFNNKENFLEEFINFIHENRKYYLHFHNKTKEEIENIILDKKISYKDTKKQEKTIKAGVLNKLVYWMATGSGKTIITSINLLQYLYYNEKIDNIILITPNETISNQHKNFLENTGIKEYVENTYYKKIQIFEITKLKEEGYTTKDKKDDGSFDAITEFKDTNNLVLVDEGHKSIKSNGGGTQKQIRDVIGLKEGSFTFEYSATFGQAINKNKDKNLQNEYSMGLLFDYSFRYFYEDKYGKRIQIENQKTKEKGQDEYLDNTLKLLLVYTQQKKFYEENPKEIVEYNIENPLITIFGHTVKSKNEEGIENPSDVYSFLKALAQIIKFDETIRNKIDEIISNSNTLELLLDYDENERINKIIEDIKKYVFLQKDTKQHITTIYVNEIKTTPGEIGLKLGENGQYFGLISVGNIQDILNKIKEEQNNLIVGKDIETSSLFEKINNGYLSMIIGSRKFTTGWNNYRISTMGLLNIGQGEGTMIIQILGRGVRLKGKKLENGKYSMKREDSGSVLEYGQTLNIIGLNSKYLEEFINSVKEEDDIDLGTNTITLDIDVKYNYKPEPELKIIKVKDSFEKEFLSKPIELGENYDINYNISNEGPISFNRKIIIDKRSTIVKYIDGEKITEKIEGVQFKKEDFNKIKTYLNKEKIYFKLNEFLQSKQNIIYNKGIGNIDNLIEKIIENNAEIYLKNDSDKKNIEKIEQIIIELLEKYINQYSKYIKLLFTTYNQEIVDFSYENNDNIPKKLKISIKNPKKTKEELEKKINSIIETIGKNINDEKCEPNPNLCLINIKPHIFYPLIYVKNNKIIEILEGEYLVLSEEKFIKNLGEYIEKSPKLLKNKEIYLLRNRSKKGIGFYFSSLGFYPDFIMWIKDNKKQYIVFIDPHGIKHESMNGDKLNAYKIIKNIHLDKENIILNSFIITPTKFNEVKDNIPEKIVDKRKFFEEKHILFMEDNNYIETLFNRILDDKQNNQQNGPVS